MKGTSYIAQSLIMLLMIQIVHLSTIKGKCGSIFYSIVISVKMQYKKVKLESLML